MLLVPVVGHMVVHGNLFPDPVSQKAHGIFVPGNDVVDYDILSLFLIGPEISVDFPSCGAVIDLPVFH